MILHDKNQSWMPPEGYIFAGLHPDGAFLRVLFHQKVFQTGTTTVIAKNVVTVILNDMGREVARTQQRVDHAVAVPVLREAEPITGWTRFKNGFFMVLIGLEEMIRCRKNS